MPSFVLLNQNTTLKYCWHVESQTPVMCQMLLSFYIYQPLSDYSDHSILLKCMYVLYFSLIDVHTHSSTCNLSLHKEKFEPASMEHNYFQLMQYIQYQAIFECTLILYLCTFLHPMVWALCLHCKGTWVRELSI